MAVRRLGISGDSISAGWVYSHSTELGGAGGWWQLISEKLANISGVGPLIGSGIRPVSLNNFFQVSPLATASEWTYTGSWTQISASTTDKGLYGYTYYCSSGSTNHATYSVPSQWRTVVAVTLYYIDTPSMGDWGIQFNGSGTVYSLNANLGISITHDLKIHALLLRAADFSLSSITQVQVRGSTSGTSTMPVGIELWYVDPTTNPDGLIVDNYSQSGRQLHELVDTTSGSDRMALFDSVTRETVNGHQAPANSPNIGIIMEHVNDAKLNDTTTYDTDLRTFYSRLSPICPVAFWNVYELAPVHSVSSGIDPTIQAAYRTQMKTTAAALSVPIIDLNDAWIQRGWANYSASLTAGLIHDDAHENAYGHQIMAEYLYGFVRKCFFATTIPSITSTWKLNTQNLINGTDCSGTPGPLGSVSSLQSGAIRVSGESNYS